MALQLPPKSASAVPEGPRQGPDPVAPGKGGGDGSMEWCPDTRTSSCRRYAVLLTVIVAVVMMGTLAVGFAILQETRLQRQDMMLREMQKRIQVLEHQMHMKSAEERGTQGQPLPDPSSEFLQSVARLPVDQGSLAPQANQTREAGVDHVLSRSKRNAHCRRTNCDTVQTLIDCKLRLLHAATRLGGLPQNQAPLFRDTFQWARPNESYFANSFEYIYEGQPYVTGIKIRQRAVYYIYSQVAMKGKQFPTEKLECGHVTVVKKGQSDDIILMKSLTSQIQSAPSAAPTEGGTLHPIDTALQAGHFILDADDVIKVKRPEMCANIRYAADPHFTYFGVSKLQDLSPSFYDCSRELY